MRKALAWTTQLLGGKHSEHVPRGQLPLLRTPGRFQNHHAWRALLIDCCLLSISAEAQGKTRPSLAGSGEKCTETSLKSTREAEKLLFLLNFRYFHRSGYDFQRYLWETYTKRQRINVGEAGERLKECQKPQDRNTFSFAGSKSIY